MISIIISLLQVLIIVSLLLYNVSVVVSGETILKFEDARSCNTTLVSNIPPPLLPHETIEDRLRVDHLLEQYWKDAKVYDAKHNKGIEYTYGEVTPLGVRQLVHEMNLSSNALPANNNNNVVFYDLGSGVGRLVVQLYLEHSKIFSKITGIELSQERHDITQSCWDAGML